MVHAAMVPAAISLPDTGRLPGRVALHRAVTPALEATLKNLPDRPGVYLMKDDRGRRRVRRQGAEPAQPRAVATGRRRRPPATVHRIRSVVDRIADVEYTLTDSVCEALLLEANLIKRYKPRFNVRLKDDKSYPYIKITLGDDFPRIERTRKLANDGSRYFGPYASASSVDESMNLIRRLFPFRTCTIDIKDGERALQRPCLLYHIKRCQGPCIEAISKADYRADIAQVELFLEGRQETLVEGARPRDERPPPSGPSSSAPRSCATRSAPSSGRWRARRWPRSRGPSSTSSAWPARTTRPPSSSSSIRDGKLIGRDVFLLDAVREAPDDEVLGELPRAVLRARDVDPARGLPARGSPRTSRTSRRSSPTAAAGRSISGRPARREARAHGARRPATRPRRWPGSRPAGWPTRARPLAALEELAEALGLPGPPARIECYDISNFQGSESVGSMVVFEDGKPRTGEYRRFRIRTVQGPNDFASHQEVLRRRFRLGQAGTGGERGGAALGDARPRDHRRRQGPGQRRQGGPRRARPPRPAAGRPRQGARGAVPAATAPSRSCCRRRHRRSTSSSACATRRTGSRSPITATCGPSGAIRSAFDDLPGVGPKRKRELLKVFGSVKRVREAPVEQIAAVPGIGRALAERIKATLEA